MIIPNTIQTSLLGTNEIKYTIILPETVLKTCLWLHGYQERSADILQKSYLEKFSETYNIAVLIPDVPDTYYLDQPWNNYYTEQFLISEFLPTITALYHLPAAREDTYIAGISMGGFGSLLLGSHFPDRFSKIVCISSAFIIDDILIGNPEVIGNFPGNLAHFQNLFGDIPSLEDSYSRNPSVAASQALKEKKLPQVFLACGTEDLLYSRNVKMRKLLELLGGDVHWCEAVGNHNWGFFNKIMGNVFEWMKL